MQSRRECAPARALCATRSSVRATGCAPLAARRAASFTRKRRACLDALGGCAAGWPADLIDSASGAAAPSFLRSLLDRGLGLTPGPVQVGDSMCAAGQCNNYTQSNLLSSTQVTHRAEGRAAHSVTARGVDSAGGASALARIFLQRPPSLTGAVGGGGPQGCPSAQCHNTWCSS